MEKKVLVLSILENGYLKADTKAMQKLDAEELTMIMRCLNDISVEIKRNLAGTKHEESSRVLEYLVDEGGVCSSINKSKIEEMSLQKAISLLENMREDSEYIISLHLPDRTNVN